MISIKHHFVNADCNKLTPTNKVNHNQFGFTNMPNSKLIITNVPAIALIYLFIIFKIFKVYIAFSMGTTMALMGLLVSNVLLNCLIKSKRVSIWESSVNEKNMTDLFPACSTPNQLEDTIKAFEVL